MKVKEHKFNNLDMFRNHTVLFRLLLCLFVCFLLGICMNQYHLPMSVYTGLLSVLFILFLVGYYFAVKKYKQYEILLRLVLINVILFFVFYIVFYEITLIVYDFSLLWQLIIVAIPTGIVLFDVIYTGYNYRRGKIKGTEIIYLISFLTFLFRAMYALYNPISNVSRQHDTIAFTNGGGHLGYIWHIWAYSKIPDVDPRTLWEFYQPPLYYLICGYWTKIYTILHIPIIESAENIQLFSLFCVTGTGIVMDGLLKRIGGNIKSRIIGALLFSVIPLFTYLAGSVNNDALLLFLFFLSYYEVIVWYQDGKIGRFILSALFTGFTVMTKISGSLIVFPILVLFLSKLIKKKDGKLLLQYLLFGVISLPLGLWWNVRNSIRFDMPFVYFHEASRESVQFIPDFSALSRVFDLKNQLNHPYIDIFNTSPNVDHNLIISTAKTAVFTSSADVMFSIVTQILGWILLILTIIGMLFGLVFIVIEGIKYLHKEKRISEYSIALILIIVSQIVFYLYFNYAHTFVHNMHARYIMPAIIAFVLLFSKRVGLFIENRLGIANKTRIILIPTMMCAYGILLSAFIMLISLITYR